jgi:biopolymer transport protein ExbD
MLEIDRVQLASAAQKEHRETPPQDHSAIAIHVHADNSLWFNSRRVTLQQLVELLKEARRKNAHKIPQLFHDKKAYFESYQSVKNAVERAGFEQLDVILQPG